MVESVVAVYPTPRGPHACSLNTQPSALNVQPYSRRARTPLNKKTWLGGPSALRAKPPRSSRLRSPLEARSAVVDRGILLVHQCARMLYGIAASPRLREMRAHGPLHF